MNFPWAEDIGWGTFMLFTYFVITMIWTWE